MSFYVIEQSYDGLNVNDPRYIDSHTYRVQTKPGCGNMSKQPILNGWLGTTNDWCECAHGEFETLESAKTAIDTLTGGEYREDDPYSYPDDEIVFRVRVGSLAPMSAAASQDWCYESMTDSINSRSTDKDIDDWVDDCAAGVADEGCLLDTDAVIRMARKYRDEQAETETD